jgi:hypothetical protein
MWDPALVWSPLGAGAPEVEAHEIVDLATAGTEARAFLGGGILREGEKSLAAGRKDAAACSLLECSSIYVCPTKGLIRGNGLNFGFVKPKIFHVILL